MAAMGGEQLQSVIVNSSVWIYIFPVGSILKLKLKSF